MPIGFVGPALQGANFIGRFGIPLLQQAGIAAGMAGIGAGVSALTNRPKAKPQQVKPRQAPFTSLSSDQLPAGAYMTEAGRTYGIDSEQVGRLGGYMDETGRVFLPANNRVTPSSHSWSAPSIGQKQLSTPAQRPPMPGLPADYKQTELAAGAAAERSRPGVGFPGQQAAAERAYQQEKSRVSQLTAQDPELQRYEAARKTAVAPGATPEQVQSAEDIGMQIWQQKYGNTPMGQPGGAVGRYNPLMERTFGYQSGSAPGQQIGAPTLGPSPLVPQVDQSLNPASPSFIGGEGGPLMNFADENLTPEMIEAYQKQLLSQAASRK